MVSGETRAENIEGVVVKGGSQTFLVGFNNVLYKLKVSKKNIKERPCNSLVQIKAKM